MARRPEILKAFGRLATETRLRGLLPPELKETVRRATAEQVGCKYCASLGEVKVDQIDKRESLAVAFAQMIAEDAKGISDSQFDVLREEFSDEEIVELVAHICLVAIAGQLFGAVMGIEAAGEAEAAEYQAALATIGRRSAT